MGGEAQRLQGDRAESGQWKGATIVLKRNQAIEKYNAVHWRDPRKHLMSLVRRHDEFPQCLRTGCTATCRTSQISVFARQVCRGQVESDEAEADSAKCAVL